MIVANGNTVFNYPEVQYVLPATMVIPGIAHGIDPKAAFEMLTLEDNISAQRGASYLTGLFQMTEY